MSIGKLLRTRAAINKVARQSNAIEVGIGVLTLVSLFMPKKNTKKKPTNARKWNHDGH